MNLKPSYIKLTGLIEPRTIDKKGVATSLKLLAYGEEEYSIKDDGTNKDIQKLVGKIVEVKGELVENKCGSKLITICAYKIIG